jgi:putative copper resistance protein D
VDFIAVALRAAAFVAVMNAAGLGLFRALFEHHLDRATRPIRRFSAWSAVGGLIAVAVHRGFEPARVTGSLDGVLDGSLHALLWSSDAGTTAAVQLLGLIVVLAGSMTSTASGRAAGIVGAVLIASSFAFMGHTVTQEARWLLGPALIVHVLIVALWFGALWPLHWIGRHEPLSLVGVVVARFSAIAAWLVPMIFVAGLVLSVALLPSLAALLTPYGTLLFAKIAGFALLMGLAALNKWRYGPAIIAGDASAMRALGVSVRVEWVIITVVLVTAAIMTSLFAPMTEH